MNAIIKLEITEVGRGIKYVETVEIRRERRNSKRLSKKRRYKEEHKNYSRI